MNHFSDQITNDIVGYQAMLSSATFISAFVFFIALFTAIYAHVKVCIYYFLEKIYKFYNFSKICKDFLNLNSINAKNNADVLKHLRSNVDYHYARHMIKSFLLE